MKVVSKFSVIVVFCLIIYGCAGPADYDISLSGGYSLIRSSAHMVTINNSSGEYTIPAKIVELAWNDKYILAKQLGLKPRDPNNPNDTYEIPDESKVSYWILQVGNGKVYGPLTDKEFVQKKKELSIPTDMELKSVSSYKK